MRIFSQIQKLYFLAFTKNLHFFGSVMVKFLQTRGSISLFQVFILQVIFHLTNFILEIPTGYIADRFGRKYSIVLGYIITTGGFWLYGSVTEYWLFIVSEIILALGVSLVSGADEALLTDSLIERNVSEAEMDTSFGRYKSMMLLGLFIASPLGSILADLFSLQLTMILTAISSFFSVLIALSLKEATIKKTSAYSNVSPFVGLQNIWRSNELLLMTFDISIILALGNAIIWLYQPLYATVGVSVFWFGFLHAGAVLIELIVMRGIGVFDTLLQNRIRYFNFSRLVMLIGVILICLSLIIESAALAILGVLLSIGFGMSRKPFFDKPVNKLIASHQRATTLSSMRMLTVFFMAFSHLTVGYVSKQSLLSACILIMIELFIVHVVFVMLYRK